MKRRFLLFASLLWLSFQIHAQEVINPILNTPEFPFLGQEVEIQFNINQLTICDTYFADVEVDYFFNEVVVNIDYNYVNVCDPSNVVWTEFQQALPLLEGTYDVRIELNVPADIALNETVYAGTIEVGGPFGFSCIEVPPVVFDFCPFVSNPVCGCNGKQYENECEAFFENNIARYRQETCADILIDKQQLFDCGLVYSSGPGQNFFTRYDCTGDLDLEANEIVVDYFHGANGPLNLNYIPADLHVLLVRLDAEGSLDCIEFTNDGQLFVPLLQAGSYYLIGDAELNNTFIQMEFCTPTVTEELQSAQASIQVYPNPSQGQFQVQLNEGFINSYTLYNSTGQLIQSGEKKTNDLLIDLSNAPSGLYYFKSMIDEQLYTQKLVLRH